MLQKRTMGATVVLMGTPSLEKTAATAVVKMPRLLRSISTCGSNLSSGHRSGCPNTDRPLNAHSLLHRL